jgi:hypothetical protein
MKLAKEQWTLEHLRNHLQYTVDLEVWTIPFYMAALYSIQDRSSKAFQSIQSIVNQEMLHVQLASNLSNAYGLSPRFPAPVYSGTTIPHLNFALDPCDPRKLFHPFSAEIGALDELRINSMCLIEYPEYDTGQEPDLRDTVTEYGSIGEFYYAVEYGAKLLERDIRGGGLQVDLFSAFYRNMPKLIVEGSGAKAFYEVALLIDTIRDQGEGRKTNEKIGEAFQNTADDSDPELNHFEKFNDIRKQKPLPLTYPLKPPADVTDRDRELQQILVNNFTGLLQTLEATFAGRKPDNFESLMVTVGGNVVNCWKHGVLPRFS